MKVIVTGVTGMVGKGVLLQCLEDQSVEEVLIISRRHYESKRPKLKELILTEFSRLNDCHSEEFTIFGLQL